MKKKNSLLTFYFLNLVKGTLYIKLHWFLKDASKKYYDLPAKKTAKSKFSTQNLKLLALITKKF